MSEQTTVLRVIVASPGDVQGERDVVPQVLEQLNRSIGREYGVRLEAVRWETDTYPGFHELGPQGLIDPILRIQDCDVLIGVFWKRFGSPIPSGESGTEHEINAAFESYHATGRPQIMVYFNEKSSTPKTKEEADQWGRVLDFRSRFPKQGLLWSYKGKANFRELLRNHLTNYLLNWRSANAKQLPEIAPPASDQDDYFAVQRLIIEEYDRTFIGREKVQSEFDLFLRTQARGYFIVRGGPGQGKTAISCRLIKKNRYVHHLVNRTGGRTDTGLILKSLLAQLRPGPESSQLPESLSELTKLFEESLLKAVSKQKPLVIVIDALDELPPSAGDPPYLVTEALPDGVFFFVTSRPGEHLDRLVQGLFATPLRFYDLGPLSLQDMQMVLRAQKPDVSTAEIERIAEASQGNPLYLHAVADQLRSGSTNNLQALPASIEGFYRGATAFLRDDDGVLREVLGLLSVIRCALSVRELSALTGRTQREINEKAIKPIRQFLIETGDSFTFYHMKFHEFVTRNIFYEDELQKSHGLIAQWLQQPANSSNPYRLASLAYHLFESGNHSGLLTTMTPEFLAAKVRRYGYAVLEDVELCTYSLLETGDPALVERCVLMVEGLREAAGGDIIPYAVRSYRSGPDAFRTKLLEPDVPSIHDLDMYVGVLPKAEIPADFYEIVVKDSRLTAAIGDVPSLGLKSAFAARFMGNLFRNFASNAASSDLANVLSHINSTIIHHDYFRRISMQCLQYDSEKQIVHLANAGHPYPVHYSARRGKCDVLPLPGDLLHDYLIRSASPTAWEEYGIEIESGDIIVLVSDGLTEGHMLEGDPYGYIFTKIVESHSSERSRAIGQAILDHWKAYPREEDSADDVSLIVIKFVSGAAAR